MEREWKVKLIEEMNPGWEDISINWSLNESLTFKTNRFLPSQE